MYRSLRPRSGELRSSHQSRRKPPFSPFRAGVIAIVLLGLFSYAVATKFANPFASSYTLHALVSNANQLRTGSAVRIAGVNIGAVQAITPVSPCKVKVSSASQQCAVAEVTMAINKTGLPIHKDATFWIRPRLFLEGAFYIDVQPGTPEAPSAPDGYVFPIQQSREPVQFDQVLTSLQSDTRSNLQILLQQYGLAVKQGGPAYNKSIQYWLPAYEYGAEVSHDTLGTQPHDLSNYIAQAAVTNGALGAHPRNLKDLVSYFNTTALALARQNVALSSAVAELPRTLRVAIPALNALEGALCSGPQPPNCSPGPLRRLARGLVPGVVSTGPMVDASLPFFHQVRELVQPSELGGLTNDLAAAVPALARLNAETIPFMKNGVRPASSCQVNQILPWSRLTVPDPNFNASNGFPPRPIYVEGVDYLPGLAGESRDTDGNGPYVRVTLTGGTITYSLQPGLFGEALAPIQGTEPQMPAPHPSGDGATVPVVRPPLEPNAPCETQPAITQSDMNAPVGNGPQPIQTPPPSTAVQQLEQATAQQVIAQVGAQAKQQGLGINLTDHLPVK
jgi:phospholipid/cholesterol/gamma-HCH transport system substrate-binding protein